MTVTTTEMQTIAEKHLNRWFAADPETSTIPLRAYVEAAIEEALFKQAALYKDGAETLRHERDQARRERDEFKAALERNTP